MSLSQQARRKAYMVLSPGALGYATLTLRSLFRHAQEPVDLHLITDSTTDKDALQEAANSVGWSDQHTCNVFAESDLDDHEEQRFARLPNLRVFRRGHPCWRKITDPLLLAERGEEMVLLDPDLFFPNHFCFEQTPANGILMMWQKPNCLLPPEVVRRAIAARIPLARHVDIGVLHWRRGSDDAELEWLDWLIGKLGGASLPRFMHIEAIVWSALAMRFGGGYLDPALWVCWRRTQVKRVQRMMRVPGPRILASEPWTQMKCFHGGGEAKYWLRDLEASGAIPPATKQVKSGRTLPFVELTQMQYEREQAAKGIVANLGYYRLFSARTS